MTQAVWRKPYRISRQDWSTKVRYQRSILYRIYMIHMISPSYSVPPRTDLLNYRTILLISPWRASWAASCWLLILILNRYTPSSMVYLRALHENREPWVISYENLNRVLILRLNQSPLGQSPKLGLFLILSPRRSLYWREWWKSICPKNENWKT